MHRLEVPDGISSHQMRQQGKGSGFMSYLRCRGFESLLPRHEMVRKAKDNDRPFENVQ